MQRFLVGLSLRNITWYIFFSFYCLHDFYQRQLSSFLCLFVKDDLLDDISKQPLEKSVQKTSITTSSSKKVAKKVDDDISSSSKLQTKQKAEQRASPSSDSLDEHENTEEEEHDEITAAKTDNNEPTMPSDDFQVE